MIILDTNVVFELMRPEPAPQVASWGPGPGQARATHHDPHPRRGPVRHCPAAGRTPKAGPPRRSRRYLHGLRRPGPAGRHRSRGKLRRHRQQPRASRQTHHQPRRAEAPQTFEALLATVTAEAACSLGEIIAASGPESISPPVRSLLDAGRAVPAVEYLNAQRYRATLRGHVDALLERCDLLALPAAAGPALRWDDPQLTDWSIARFFPPSTSPGHPAISIPLPANGLPLVGRRNADALSWPPRTGSRPN